MPIDEFTEHQINTVDNALFKLEKEEQSKAIQNCIALLPSEDSFLLTLYYFDDMTLDEIAKTVNLKTNNIKVKIHRSRKKLATVLKRHLEPEIIEQYER